MSLTRERGVCKVAKAQNAQHTYMNIIGILIYTSNDCLFFLNWKCPGNTCGDSEEDKGVRD